MRRVNPIKIVAIVLLVSMMLHAGFLMNRDHLRAVLANYGLLGRALLANFIAVPLYGVVVVRLFHLSDPIATGVLLMAISPGVPFLVVSAGRAKGGSLGFAVALAFLMPAISVVTVPITALLVLPGSHISATSLVVTLVAFQLIPLLLGMLVNDRAPEVASRLERPVGIVVLIALVVLLALLGPLIVRSVSTVYGTFGILAMLTIVILSLLTGWALGGPERAYRRTLSIGTALRNIGLAAVVASTTFEGSVSAAVLTYLVVQVVLTGVVGAYFRRTAVVSEAV